MEEALTALLVNDAGVADLVATFEAKICVDWLIRPQASGLPAVTLQRVAGRRDMTLQGPSGLVDSLVQIDCWAASYAEAKALARAVIAALDTATGDPWRSDFMVVAERDGHERGEAPRDDRSTDFFRTSLDVRVWHLEP